MLAQSFPAPDIGSAPDQACRDGSLPGRASLLRTAAPGFTLLEIAVVLFIMGLMMSIALPYFGGLTGARLKSQARRLAGCA